MKKTFSKALRIVSIIGLFSLVFGSFLISPTKVNAQAVPAGVGITVSPGSVCSGNPIHLQWSSENATVSISPGIGSVDPFGELTLHPTQSTTYTITGTNSTGGFGQATARVTVTGSCQGGQNPTVSITADDTSIDEDDSTTVRWNSNNATSCTASGGTNGWSGSKGTSGSFNTGSLSDDETYSITCRDSEGDTASDSVTIRVDEEEEDEDEDEPTVTLRADDTSISSGDNTTLRWTSTDADSCRASSGTNGWSGSKSRSGNFNTGRLTQTTTYRIECENDEGEDDDSVTVTVSGQTYAYPTPYQTPYPTPYQTPSIIYPTPYQTPISRPTSNSLVIINSSIDRNQPIVPTIDNSRPRPGDEINYTVTYQNIGNSPITSLTLRLDLPQEVDYMFSSPANPTRSGNTLIFSLGTLRANGQGTVTVRVRVRDNISNGTDLDFPATLSYIDPSGNPQSVNANVSAEVSNGSIFGANPFWSGSFFPGNIFGWLLLIALIVILMLLVRYLFLPPNREIHPTMIER